jgi:hypothetical protein
MGQQGLEALAEQDPDPVAPPDAGGGKHVREPVGGPLQVETAVPADLARAPLLDQGQPVVGTGVPIADRIRDVEGARDLPAEVPPQGLEIACRLQHAPKLPA